MKLKYMFFVIALSFHVNNSFSGVLQAASGFLSLYDSVVDKIYMDSEKFGNFLMDCKKSGIYERIEVVRMMHSTLLSKEQPSPISPIQLYLKKISRLPTAAPSPEGCYNIMGVLGLVEPVVITFQDLKEDENLEEKLKKIMLDLLDILNKDSTFINMCGELNLLQKYMDTIEIISACQKTPEKRLLIQSDKR